MLQRLPLILIAFFIGLTAFAQNLEIVKNQGQWKAPFQYKVNVPSGAMFFHSDASIIYHFKDLEKWHHLHETGKQLKQNISIKGHSFKMQFLGAQWPTRAVETQFKKNYINYFVGNDKSRWRSGIHPFKQLTYQNVYSGIHFQVITKNNRLKYNIIVEPNANAEKIAYTYKHVDALKINNLGQLEIMYSFGRLIEDRPVAFQVINGDTQYVEIEFQLKKNTISYHIKEEYNRNKPLIIDPYLVFGTYTGSTTDNWGYTATFDGNGYLYAGGIAFGIGYPTTTGAYQTTFAGGNAPFPCDISITKFDTSGSFLIYSTYLGGNSNELPHSIIVNNYNELFIFGTTGSSNFPTTSTAFDTTFNGGPNTATSMNISFPAGSDIFISRLSANGTTLNASTYVGGSANDGLNLSPPLRANYADEVRGEIDIDNQNKIYIATTTRSTDFPVSGNAFQTVFGGGASDGIVFKMDNALSTILWASYIGGSQLDAVYALALYNNNDIAITGGTNSTNFPTAGPSIYTTFNGGTCDGFLTRIKADGSQMLRSMFVGSDQYDQSYLIEIDQSQNVHVAGQTGKDSTYWIQNALYNVPSGGQFLRKYDTTLTSVIWSTAFGNGDGDPDISLSAFLVDVCNKIYISGWGGLVNANFMPGSTTNNLPVTSGAFQTTTDGSDYYLLVIDDSSNSLVYATFYGGSISAEHVDGGTSRFNKKGEIYQAVCAGCGSNNDFPTTPGAYSQINGSSNCNNGLFKFAFNFPIVLANFQLPTSICAPFSIQFNNQSIGGNKFLWKFGDGDTSSAANPTHTYTQGGTYTITLVIQDTTGASCNLSDSISKTLIVLSNSTQILPDTTICAGQTVEIGISPNGDPTITYNWTPGTALSDSTSPKVFATPTDTTIYMLLINNGVCTDTLIQTVNVGNLYSNPDSTITICSGASTQIGFNGSGLGITNFTWSPTGGLSNPGILQPTATPSSTTTYSLYYTNGYCSDSVSYTINVIDGQKYIKPPLMVCAGDSVQFNIPESQGYTNFNWTPGTFLTDSTIAEPQAFPNQSTVYTLYMSNGFCNDTVVQPIQANLTPFITESSDSICAGEEITIGITDTTNANFNYFWMPSGIFIDPTLPQQTVSPTVTTTYIVNYSNAQDSTLCNGIDSITIYIAPPPPLPSFTYLETGSCDGVGLVFNNVISGDSSVWLLNNGVISTNQVPNPIIGFGDTVYITLQNHNAYCSASYTKKIIGSSFSDVFNIIMPNLFSPFGSPGINDTYCPIGYVEGESSACFMMWIYNRWGRKVFEGKLSEPCWNGRIRDTDRKVENGVYYYVVQYGYGSQGIGEKIHGFVQVVGR